MTNDDNKIKDLYGISSSEAVILWKDGLYTNVLRHKIALAKELQKKLLNVNMMKRDSKRIQRIAEAINFNYRLIKEVEKWEMI